MTAHKTNGSRDYMPGDVEPAVDEGDLAGDAAGEGRAEEEGGVADFDLLDIAVQRSACGDGGQDLAEVPDAAGGEEF